MTSLTQYEFAIAMIIAGSLLLVLRYWRFFFLLTIGMLLLIWRDDFHDRD